MLILAPAFISPSSSLMADDKSDIDDVLDKAYHYFEDYNDEKCVEYYDKALDINNELPEAHYNIAVCLDNLGEYEDAKLHLENYLLIRPDSDDREDVLKYIDDLQFAIDNPTDDETQNRSDDEKPTIIFPVVDFSTGFTAYLIHEKITGGGLVFDNESAVLTLVSSLFYYELYNKLKKDFRVITPKVECPFSYYIPIHMEDGYQDVDFNYLIEESEEYCALNYVYDKEHSDDLESSGADIDNIFNDQQVDFCFAKLIFNSKTVGDCFNNDIIEDFSYAFDYDTGFFIQGYENEFQQLADYVDSDALYIVELVSADTKTKRRVEVVARMITIDMKQKKVVNMLDIELSLIVFKTISYDIKVKQVKVFLENSPYDISSLF